MEYENLKVLLPNYVAELADIQSNKDENNQYLYSVITSLSALMPRVTIKSEHAGTSVNLNYININDCYDDDSGYNTMRLLEKVNEDVSRCVNRDRKKLHLEETAFKFMESCYYTDPVAFYMNLKTLEDYGLLLFTSFPQNYLSYLASNKKGDKYDIMRNIMDNKDFTFKVTRKQTETMHHPKLSMIFNCLVDQISSLSKEKEQANYARFLFTETQHTHPNFLMCDPDFERLCRLSKKKAGSVKMFFRRLLAYNIEVSPTSEQLMEFDQYCESVLNATSYRDKAKIILIIKEYKQNLIKLASVLTVVRADEENRLDKELTIQPCDFKAAFEMIKDSIRICMKLYAIHGNF